MDNRPTPPEPKYCRTCKGDLDSIPFSANSQEPMEDGRYGEVVDYDIYTSKPKTIKYIYACRNLADVHTRLVVLENPARNFRAVIREDRFDESFLKK